MASTLSLVCLLLACSAAATAAAAVLPLESNSTTGLGSLIGWQTHSWDDLREWRAGLLKGSWLFKVDFSFNPEEHCALQEHVPQPADPRGCLLLTHTATSLGVGKDGPWSSSDVLEFLKNPINRDLLKKPSRRKLFSINFKDRPNDPCDGSAAAENWVSLFDDFYHDATTLISSLHLNVEFYWDSLPYNSCVTSRWPKWVSTWDASEPYDSRAYDNNVTNHNDRYQVLNRDAGDGLGSREVIALARNHWLKFGDSKYPLVVYEPTDEIDLNLINDIFLSSGYNHTAGYTVAFNGDPVMHTLYSASRSRKALHVQITQDLKFNVTSQPSVSSLTVAKSWPQITTIDTSAAKDGSTFITVTVYADTQGVGRYISQLGSAPTPDPFSAAPPPAVVFSNYTELVHTALPQSGQPNDRYASISSFFVASKAYVVVGDVNAGAQIYTLNTSSGALQPSATFSFPNLRQASYERTAMAALPWPGLAGMGNGAVAFVQVSSGHYLMGQHCTVWVQLFALDFSSLDGAAPAPVPRAVGAAVCASIRIGATQVSVAAVRAVQTSRCSTNPVYGTSNAIEAFVASGNQFGEFNVGVESQVHLAQVCLDTDNGGASNTVVPSLSAQPQLFTVGDFPTVAAVTAPGANFTMVFVTATNGFCPNTYPDNDTPFGAPLICDKHRNGRAHPVVGALSYTYGRADEFARQLAASSHAPNPSEPLANVCNDKLLHGIYDQGYQPTASVVHTPAGFLAHAVHAGLQGIAQNTCGAPLPADGVVLDAFLLSTPAAHVPASNRVGPRSTPAHSLRANKRMMMEL